MALEAVVQDLYPANNLFLETLTTFSAYDNTNLLPNYNFSFDNSFISQDLLRNDSFEDNSTTLCDYYYYYYYSSLSPPDPDPMLGGTSYNNNLVTTATKVVSIGTDNNDDQDHRQVWAAGPNNANYSSPEGGEYYGRPVVVTTRPKRRRRARARKNKEDVENQRMTHIAVERNRRKQMNDYLALLRSLMPHSYVQRGDQASIVGGAINYVKELEQNLQSLSTKKENNKTDNNNNSLPFGEFFTFPQFSTVDGGATSCAATSDRDDKAAGISQCGDGGGGAVVVADVEVTMVESHALVKIRSKRPPKQLSKLVMGLQGLRLTVLHLNLTKVDGVALYSFSLKVEDESKLSSVDEIAGAVHQLLCRMQEEANLNC